MRLKSTTRLLTAALLLSFSQLSTATILTFDDLTADNYDPIDQNYGDNVNSTSDATGSYLEGNGFTDQISVSYNTVGQGNHLEAWNAGYGDLTNVAYADSHGFNAEITLTANLGYLVTLNSFDLAGYNGDRTASIIAILDENNDTLWSLTNQFILGGNGHSSFFPGVTSSSLTILWGNDWNIGIDNINFDQSLASITTPTPIPEPSMIALLTLGVLGLGLSRRKIK